MECNLQNYYFTRKVVDKLRVVLGFFKITGGSHNSTSRAILKLFLAFLKFIFFFISCVIATHFKDVTKLISFPLAFPLCQSHDSVCN